MTNHFTKKARNYIAVCVLSAAYMRIGVMVIIIIIIRLTAQTKALHLQGVARIQSGACIGQSNQMIVF